MHQIHAAAMAMADYIGCPVSKNDIPYVSLFVDWSVGTLGSYYIRFRNIIWKITVLKNAFDLNELRSEMVSV